MEPWEIMISESQERMVAVVRPSARRTVSEVCERWELAFAVIGRGDRHRRAALHLRGTRSSARSRPSYLTDEAPRYEVPQHAAAAGQGRCAPPKGPETRRGAPPAARVRRTSAAAPGSTTGTTTSSARARYGGPGSTQLSCGCGPRCAASPSRSTGPDGCAGSTRAPAAPPPCSRRRGTSPAPAASRSRSPTASTSATPRSPRSAGSSREAIEGIAEACEALGLPIVSGNVSLYNETEGRPIYPTPRSAASGWWPTYGSSPATGARATRSSSPAHPALALDGSEYQALFGELRGQPAPLDLAGGGGADRVSLAQRAAPLASRTTPPKAGSPSAWRRRRSRAGWAPSSTCRTTASRCSARAGGRRSSRARRRRRKRSPACRCSESGRSAETTLGALPVAALREAWET